MNPRLVEPGFAVVCLHADVPARPGKDENGEDDAQVSTTTWETAGYLHCQARARAFRLSATVGGRILSLPSTVNGKR